MRKLVTYFILTAALAAPALAQNTDIESLSGLQFNFANPGARALGMGGAFLGLADDASAAEANPAGLTILRKAEVSIEVRNYFAEQVLTVSGTYPEVNRRGFGSYSDRAEVSFASVVYPIKKFTLGAYYHEPLRNRAEGFAIPERDRFTNRFEESIPNFFLPRNGPAPVTEAECQAIRQRENSPTACLEYQINPFYTTVDVQQRTFGLAGAYNFGKLSVGGAVRYQTFREGAFVFRLTPPDPFSGNMSLSSISVQATATNESGEVELEDQTDVTFSVGFKFAPNDKFSFGGVYKKGPEFVTPTFIATTGTDFEFLELAETPEDRTTFHIPDIMGLGVSFRPIPVLTINLDAVHVKYTNLVDNFKSTVADIQGVDTSYAVDDALEVRLGGEYFFPTKIPFALRAGYWRDPAHSLEWRGPLNRADFVAAKMLYPEGETQNHFSIGAGLAWPRFQVDLAYDTSQHFKVGSISMVSRF
ncbi:MAG TPA: hypothetical protein VFL80_00405 [Thermoanaerobaculia bacterium]|nr:hypothetical protein [Thermoanaerobaculia bacterium]